MTADYTDRMDTMLISVPTGVFSGEGRVCYEERHPDGFKSHKWYKAQIKIDDPSCLMGTATFGTEEVEFSFLADEAVPEMTHDRSPNPGSFIDQCPSAAVVFTQDLRTGAQRKWLYPGQRNLFEFCAAVNQYDYRHGRRGNLFAPPEIRGISLRDLAAIEAAQEAARGTIPRLSGQGVHIVYTSKEDWPPER